MKKLDSLLRGRKCLVFVDFEGTQFSHEMISIGAVLCTLDRHNQIKTRKEPFKILVKAKNKVGNYVVDLTKITDEMLKKEGKSFNDALLIFKKYLGTKWKKCLFITYGNHDMRIFNQSISYNFTYPKDFCSQFQKNYADFAAFIAEFVRDPNGNPLSLIHNCELFDAEIVEPAHDPRSDAINLANLYEAFIKHPDIIKEEYKKALLKVSHFPQPVKDSVMRLVDGQDVTAADFDKYVKEYLK